jgi:hypothetical protein
MALSVRYFSHHSIAELIRIFLVFGKKVAVIFKERFPSIKRIQRRRRKCLCARCIILEAARMKIKMCPYRPF